MNATDALENLILQHLLRSSAWGKPGAIWVGLFTALPGLDSAQAPNEGDEVRKGFGDKAGYARIQHGPGDGYWTLTDHGTVVNTTDIVFSSPTTAGWGTVVGFGLWGSLSGADMLFFKELTQHRNILQGDYPPTFESGDLTISFD